MFRVERTTECSMLTCYDDIGGCVERMSAGNVVQGVNLKFFWVVTLL